ncbi:hypothetical protein [Cylindrospermopsis raciborskii]|uniref:hypothetical protein n=1 Tax=Cylindrospermopsis raciborskii TaxID=77022 RepID=UPI001454C759|nr:hypothetical protein [Cylindrospermopsis raciborskii]
MQVIETNTLFAQVSGEQSAVVSGGTAYRGAITLAAFLAVGSFSYQDALTVIAVTYAPA